ncbi:MAG: hypothetical protein AABY62_01130 [Pseudomonadota bacterium]
MDFGLIHTVWTIILIAIFFGIVRWAWSSRRHASFERAEREPLLEEEPCSLSRPSPSLPLPEGEGGEPSALRAASFTRGESRHG